MGKVLARTARAERPGGLTPPGGVALRGGAPAHNPATETPDLAVGSAPRERWLFPPGVQGADVNQATSR